MSCGKKKSKHINNTEYIKWCFQASDVSIQCTILAALKGVIAYAGKSISSSVKNRACSIIKDFIQLDDEELRSSAAKALGAISKVIKSVNFLIENLFSL